MKTVRNSSPRLGCISSILLLLLIFWLARTLHIPHVTRERLEQATLTEDFELINLYPEEFHQQLITTPHCTIIWGSYGFQRGIYLIEDSQGNRTWMLSKYLYPAKKVLEYMPLQVEVMWIVGDFKLFIIKELKRGEFEPAYELEKDRNGYHYLSNAPDYEK